ncbi:DUF3616 domain-containing protein [Pontibacter qinzhouensis]|uniref:DUF3616 domain-containing protein n=1 Tax=Pontibacter qinzhouensis TaxID=2603253 RepID=A0A5C8J5M5_9BACT|nr:DUF3616 domain-containing protein [Pontibacter qinzhouensis]TXK31565.1 DUF3616 domain-containing protein [Pontibacter qinzhouensis]
MAQQIKLQFTASKSLNADGKHVRDGLSTVLRTGNNIWTGCDERTTIERLACLPDGSLGEHASFALSDYLHLPGKPGQEIDIEGMGLAGNYLWVIGSHSLKRKKPRKSDSVPDQQKRLATVKAEANRYMLARIPILLDCETGNYTLHKKCPNPDEPGELLWAAQLQSGKNGNELTEALQQDEHLKDFFRIPSKDNGFDIEGLTVVGKRLFIGLRGPVLRGWSVVLEIEVDELADKQGYLHLKQITPERPYKKHFLHLKGKGIRELRLLGDDLYILAGPTMDLDGTIVLYRWPNALAQQTESMLHNSELERLHEIPHGTGATTGQDKAEGLAIYDDSTLLVVFDSPTDARKVGNDAVLGDLIKVK